jgi:hypothetical protein
VDWAHVENAEDLGAVDGPFETAAGDDLREVEEGAGERCARDAVDGLDVAWEERRAAVGGDAVDVSSPAVRARDVDGGSVVVAEAAGAGR